MLPSRVRNTIPNALSACALAVALLAASCADDGADGTGGSSASPSATAPSSGPGASGGGDGSGGSANEACDEPGEVRACKVTIGTQNGVLSCLAGQQICGEEGWSPCEGTITSRKMPRGLVDGMTSDDLEDPWQLVAWRAARDARLEEELLGDGAEGSSFRALTNNTSCNSPCDPECEAFPDPINDVSPLSPTGTAVPSSPAIGGGQAEWLAALPNGFEPRLQQNPCVTGTAGLNTCQADSRCVAGSPNRCNQFPESGSGAAVGIDYTVGIPCGNSSSARIPICNRGSANAPGPVTLWFDTGNSQDLANAAASCAVPVNKNPSHTCTITGNIPAGTCVLAPASCAAGLTGNNKTLYINPQRMPNRQVPFVVEPAGYCKNNFSMWRDSVSCAACTPTYEDLTVTKTGATCNRLTSVGLLFASILQRPLTGSTKLNAAAAYLPANEVQEAQGCMSGREFWIDQSGAFARVNICPALCSTLIAGTSTFRLQSDCPKTYNSSLAASLKYEGVCGLGQRAQWGYLGYNALVPDNSSVKFDVRTATTEAALASQSYLLVANAKATDPAACRLNDPDANCPIDLYDELGGPPKATNPFLELRYTLAPSSSQRRSPVLYEIQTTFTCEYSE